MHCEKRDQNAKSMKQSKQSTKLSFNEFFLVNAISFINLFMSIDAENCAHALVEWAILQNSWCF